MDLQFTPEEEAFRLKVRSWLEENMPTSGLSDTREGRDDKTWLARAKAWQRRLYEAGYVALAWPKEYGGQAMDPVRQSIVNDEMVRARAPYHRRRLRPRDARADAHLVGHRGTEAALPAENSDRRGNLVPGLLRARRRLRPGVAEDARGNRRRRVRRQRPESLDLRRAVRRHDVLPGAHRPRGAQASRHLLHPHRHAHPRHHRAPAGPDDRRSRLQRGLFRQRPRAAQKPGRQAQRRMDGRQRHAVP